MEEGELFKYLVEFHNGIGIELQTALDFRSVKMRQYLVPWLPWSFIFAVNRVVVVVFAH